MIWRGKNHYRWRRRFALFPVVVSKRDGDPVWCWWRFYEWRWIENGPLFSFNFERRATNASESVAIYKPYM